MVLGFDDDAEEIIIAGQGFEDRLASIERQRNLANAFSDRIYGEERRAQYLTPEVAPQIHIRLATSVSRDRITHGFRSVLRTL